MNILEINYIINVWLETFNTWNNNKPQAREWIYSFFNPEPVNKLKKWLLIHVVYNKKPISNFIINGYEFCKIIF